MSTADPRRWRMLPVILLASLLASFDFNVVNVAVPSLEASLHASQAALELVVGGYAFTYAAALVTGGRMGDLFGYRRMWLLGMAGFTVASALCGLAQSPGQLVAARMLQGLTAAAMAPQTIALITATFPAPERPKALAWFGAAIGMGGIAGQVLGGVLINADLFGWGWRTIFFVNLPIGAIALPLAARWLPEGRSASRPRLDPLGVLGVSGSLALALAPLILGREAGWPAWAWGCLVASVFVMALTVGWERNLGRKGGQPLLDVSLFRNRDFSVGLTVNIAFMVVFSSFMFVTSLLLQAGLGFSVLDAGFAFGPFAILSMLASMFGRRVIEKFGPKALIAGSGIVTAGVLILAGEMYVLGEDVTAAWLIPAVALVGLGFGLVLPSLVGAVISGINPAQAGVASGVLTTTQQFCNAAGVAALGAVFFAVLGQGTSRADFTTAAGLVYAIDVLLCVVLTILFAALPRLSGTKTAAPAAAGKPASATV